MTLILRHSKNRFKLEATAVMGLGLACKFLLGPLQIHPVASSAQI